MQEKSSRWCFTLANPGDRRPDWEDLRDAHGAVYMIYQLEIAPSTGTPHLQGYIRFTTHRQGSSVKRWLGWPEVHMEKARGDERQNKDYCSKADTRAPGEEPHEFGDFDDTAGKQGHRSDLDELAEAIKGGMTEREIATRWTKSFILHASGIQAAITVAGPVGALERTVHVRVYFGPTATGKTHRVMHEDPEVYMVGPGRDPWGLYAGQKSICFDEFNWEKWDITMMNRYLDKWRLSLDRRYRDRFAEWTRVTICANSSPLTWWPNEQFPIVQAFRRRIWNNVYEISSKEQSLEDALCRECCGAL